MNGGLYGFRCRDFSGDFLAPVKPYYDRYTIGMHIWILSADWPPHEALWAKGKGRTARISCILSWQVANEFPILLIQYAVHTVLVLHIYLRR